MDDPAHQGRIGRARQLVVLKSNDENFFDAHFVFICVKCRKKVHSQLCSILLGLGQPHVILNCRPGGSSQNGGAMYWNLQIFLITLRKNLQLFRKNEGAIAPSAPYAPPALNWFNTIWTHLEASGHDGMNPFPPSLLSNINFALLAEFPFLFSTSKTSLREL